MTAEGLVGGGDRRDSAARRNIWSATPVHGPVDAEFHVGMMATAPLLAGGLVRSGPDVVVNRNALVAEFLEGDGEWLWWVDADQVPNPWLLERLVADADEFDARIVGALVFSVHPGRQLVPCAWQMGEGGPVRVDPRRVGARVVRVDAVGCGCVLVHREVFEKVAGDPQFGGSPWPWFARTPWRRDDGEWDQIGEDVTFFLRARKVGFDVWVDVDAVCPHRKTVAFP